MAQIRVATLVSSLKHTSTSKNGSILISASIALWADCGHALTILSYPVGTGHEARIKLPDVDAGDGLQDIVKISRADPQTAGAHSDGEELVPDAEARNPEQEPRRRDAAA